MNKIFHKIICLAIMLMVCGNAMADIVSPTTCDGCTWKITDAGVLIISPTNGTSGQMGTWTDGDDGKYVPWFEKRSSITSAEIVSGVRFSTCGYLFNNCTNLKSVTFGDANCTEGVEDMNSMFNQCSQLTLETIDLSKINTSSVKYMTGMFSGCQGFTSLDLSSWDMSKVELMNNMFYGCSGLTSLKIAGSNIVSSVKEINQFVYNCDHLQALDLSSLDFANVTTSTKALYHDAGDLFKSRLVAIYMPTNLTPIDNINTFLATKKDGEMCALYFPAHNKTNYTSLGVLGTDYPYTLGQYILAGDITDDYKTIDPGYEQQGVAWTFTVGELRYFRKVKNNWGTIILPWKIASSSSYTLCNPSKISDHLLKVTRALTSPSGIEDGKPYVFYATSSTISYSSPAELIFTNSEEMTSDDVVFGNSVIAGKNLSADKTTTLIGVYGNGTDHSDYVFSAGSVNYVYYYQSNQFWHATGQLTVPCFRAYLKSSSTASSSAKSLNIVFDDEDDVSGIEEIEIGVDNTAAYNLAGQRLSAPAKGQINIINGKKVIVK